MLGAIVGDTVGSPYEFNNRRTKDFPLFSADSIYTDDTILSVAVAEVLLQDDAPPPDVFPSPAANPYIAAFKRYYRAYPSPCGGYGARFQQWASSPDTEPYNSWGNGSAMRVSPVAYAYVDLDAVLAAARATAEATHNHPEGIKGAQATAAAIFLARTGAAKPEIQAAIETRFGYDLHRDLDAVRTVYAYNESCQQTVPEALIAALQSTDFEDALRNAVSLGGDSDTLTCITGAVAEALYGGVPAAIAEPVWARLDPPLAAVVRRFMTRYPVPQP